MNKKKKKPKKEQIVAIGRPPIHNVHIPKHPFGPERVYEEKDRKDQ